MMRYINSHYITLQKQLSKHQITHLYQKRRLNTANNELQKKMQMQLWMQKLVFTSK